MRQLYFEDFQVGDRFRSPSRTLTDAHFLFFAGPTGDNHPPPHLYLIAYRPAA